MRLITFRPSFQSEWLALPFKEVQQIGDKIQMLAADPLPDGKVKKRLRHMERGLCRIRSGDYRIFYTFDDRYVSLLAVRRRDDSTYAADSVDAEFLGGGPDVDVATATDAHHVASRMLSPQSGPARPLPRGLTQELLNQLLVPLQFHLALLKVKDEDALLGCSEVPDEFLLRVHEALFEKPLPEIVQQKEYVAFSVEDLLRFKEGDLLAFLLRLSEEQEKFVTFAVHSKGPTLVKGGPGTGKSTVALYRAQSVLSVLRKSGVQQPRVLFTTYTNALVTFSEQLLSSLLGTDAATVSVRTADSVAMRIVTSAEGTKKMAATAELKAAMLKAVMNARYPGSSLRVRAQRQTIERLGVDYLLEEIGGVIDGRRLNAFVDYARASRPGRRVSLSEMQRQAVWAVRDAFHQVLDAMQLTSWHRLRARAAELVLQGRGPAPYDAVIIDEAQDLDPSAVQMLVALCRAPGRLFLTADADQSIYGSGFRWADVHESLSFRGRTGILRANYRSTREIGEAARHYLREGALEHTDTTPTYVNSGPAPAFRVVRDGTSEAALLRRFLLGACRELKFGIGACAVLVPTEKAGKRIARQLTEQGTAAQFMTGKGLDLSAKVVKVITLRSAKGLEFPIVVLAGFDGEYPYTNADASAEERGEKLAQERRTLFVGMTRAMRALLVVRHGACTSPLLEEFDAAVWNVEVCEQTA